MIFTESNLVIILILTILDNLCKNSTSCIMQNLHFTTCKKMHVIISLYMEKCGVQILHIPHFDKCYYYGECQNYVTKRNFCVLFSYFSILFLTFVLASEGVAVIFMQPSESVFLI